MGRGLSQLQTRALAIALSQCQRRGDPVVPYCVSARLCEPGTPAAAWCAAAHEAYQPSAEEAEQCRWLRMEAAIRSADNEAGENWRRFEAQLTPHGFTLAGAVYPRAGDFAVFGRLQPGDWRSLRPFLADLRRAGLAPMVCIRQLVTMPDPWATLRPIAWDVSVQDVLARLYDAEKRKTPAARVAAARALERLADRGLLFHLGRSAFALSGEGLAVAMGEDGGEGGCILEAASRMQPKKRKGRPLGWGYHATAGGEVSDRTASNERWANHAAFCFRDAVGDTRRFMPLFGVAFDQDGKYVHEGGYRSFVPNVTVASELGRLIARYSDGMQCALKVAEELINERPVPSAKEMARRIRAYRRAAVKAPRVGEASELEEILVRATDEYLSRRPDTPLEEIEKALDGVRWFHVDFVREESEAGADA